MVNAKNKEIAETNIEIAKAVSEIKNDTISPKNNIDQIVERQEAKISKANEKLKIQSEKLKILAEKSMEKSAELKKIAKEKGDNSYEFELKAKELKQLSNEMDKIVDKDLAYHLEMESVGKMSSQNPKLKLESSQIQRIFPDGDNYKIRIHGKKNEQGLDLEDFLYSKDFKEKSGLTDEQIRTMKEQLNLSGNKVNRFYINGKVVSSNKNQSIPPTPPSPPTPPNSDELKKIVKEYSLKGFNFNSEKNPSNLSKKEIRKLEKLSKEKAEIEKKLLKIRKEQRELQGSPWIIGVDAHVKPDVKYTVTSSYIDTNNLNDKAITTAKKYKEVEKAAILLSNFEDDAKIYINGKLSSKSDVDVLNSKNISKVNINKSTSNGQNKNEIHIETK